MHHLIRRIPVDLVFLRFFANSERVAHDYRTSDSGPFLLKSTFNLSPTRSDGHRVAMQVAKTDLGVRGCPPAALNQNPGINSTRESVLTVRAPMISEARRSAWRAVCVKKRRRKREGHGRAIMCFERESAAVRVLMWLSEGVQVGRSVCFVVWGQSCGVVARPCVVRRHFERDVCGARARPPSSARASFRSRRGIGSL